MKTININGKEVNFVGDGELTYEEICNIAHPPQQTVTYHSKEGNGSVCKGKSIKVIDGMSITCVFTGNA